MFLYSLLIQPVRLEYAWPSDCGGGETRECVLVISETGRLLGAEIARTDAIGILYTHR